MANFSIEGIDGIGHHVVTVGEVFQKFGFEVRIHSQHVLQDQNLSVHVWYRSPLWDRDHLLGEDPVFRDENLAWCGRALDDTSPPLYDGRYDG